jgi:hypothetical protein
MAPNEQLRAWIGLASISNAEAARLCEYDRSNFHRLLSGALKPPLDLAAKIEQVTSGAVPMSAWVGFEPTRKQAA